VPYRGSDSGVSEMIFSPLPAHKSGFTAPAPTHLALTTAVPGRFGNRR
jgi:hypothetical protein